MTDDSALKARVDVLKQLRQGEGMTLERVRNLPVSERRAIIPDDDPSPENVFNLVRWAAISLLDDQYSVAIKNALGIGEDVVEGNLTERRMSLLERLDVKLRTLINHEDTGAELLAQQIDITRKVRQDLGTIDVMEVAASVDQLRARLDRAEQVNRELRFMVLSLMFGVFDHWPVLFLTNHRIGRNIDQLLGMDSDDEVIEWFKGLPADEDWSDEHANETIMALLPPGGEHDDEHADKAVDRLARIMRSLYGDSSNAHMENWVASLERQVDELKGSKTSNPPSDVD